MSPLLVVVTLPPILTWNLTGGVLEDSLPFKGTPERQVPAPSCWEGYDTLAMTVDGLAVSGRGAQNRKQQWVIISTERGISENVNKWELLNIKQVVCRFDLWFRFPTCHFGTCFGATAESGMQ